MNLQNMAPNARRSLMISALFGLLAVGLYLGAVKPAIREKLGTGRVLREKKSFHDTMMKNLAGADRVKKRIAEAEAKLGPYREAMLEPLLESLAMRAKSILDPLAFGAGLGDTDYTELTPLALPVPKHLPVQLHARQPVKFTARGSYQSAISFLMRVEKEFPLVTLEAIEISAQKEPNVQKIEMVFEWPVRGRVTRTAAERKEAGK